MTMNNPYFEIINKEIIAGVEDNGDVIITRDSDLDSGRQIRQIETLIEEKVDIIVLNPVDWKKVLPALKKAKDSGIPVLAVDAEVYDKEYVSGVIVSNNYQAGVMAAQDLMKRRKEGKILFMIQSNNKSASDRIDGFKKTLEEANWNYEIVDELECMGQLEIAQPLVEKVLEQRKDIDVVMALNDPSALGAMAALDQKGLLSDVLVYGVDGAPSAKTMIRDGKMTATIAQSPTHIGKLAVDYLYDILDGKEVGEKTVLPVTMITQENIDNYNVYAWE